MALSLSDSTSRKRPRTKLVQDTEHKNKSRKCAFTDFITFCNFVLAYEEQLAADDSPVKQLDTQEADSLEPRRTDIQPSGGGGGGGGRGGGGSERRKVEKAVTGSAGESLNSSTSSSSTGESESSDETSSSSLGRSPESPTNEQLSYTSDDESWNTVTCFCGRPFAGRPMIECSECLTWIHLYCARIKRSHVPEVYTCPKCRTKLEKRVGRRKSRDATSEESIA